MIPWRSEEGDDQFCQFLKLIFSKGAEVSTGVNYTSNLYCTIILFNVYKAITDFFSVDNISIAIENRVLCVSCGVEQLVHSIELRRERWCFDDGRALVHSQACSNCNAAVLRQCPHVEID